MAVFFIPYPYIVGSSIDLIDLKFGFFLGCIFFISQLTCFFALEKGDASMVTPIMGSKSVFVALFVFLFELTREPSGGTWIATILAAFAVLLIAWPSKVGKTCNLAILLGLLTAAGFGLTDALVPGLSQQSNPFNVLFIMFFTVGFNSCILIPFVNGKFFRFDQKSDKWMFLSCIPMGVQAVLMSQAIAFYTVPAEANVFYACRGIWSILLAVWLGKKLGLNETKTESIVFIRRLIGAILLVIGIYFTF